MEDVTAIIGREKGSYVLVAFLAFEKPIAVGKLGAFSFPFGFYAYAGSAFGPGGLAARVGHHLKESRKPHWHMDYFRKHACMKQVWFCRGKNCSEHDFACALSRLEGSPTPIKGFGCSDCICVSHIYRFEKLPDFEAFEKESRKIAPGVSGLNAIVLE